MYLFEPVVFFHDESKSVINFLLPPIVFEIQPFQSAPCTQWQTLSYSHGLRAYRQFEIFNVKFWIQIACTIHFSALVSITYQKTRKTFFRIDLVDRFVKFLLFHILSNFRNYFLSKKCMGVQFSYTPCDFVVLKATQNLVPNLCQRALTFFKNFMFYPKI